MTFQQTESNMGSPEASSYLQAVCSKHSHEALPGVHEILISYAIACRSLLPTQQTIDVPHAMGVVFIALKI